MIVSIEPRTPKVVKDIANGITRTAKDNLIGEIDENDLCTEEVPEDMGGGCREISPCILNGIDRGYNNMGMPFVIEINETDSNERRNVNSTGNKERLHPV